MNVKSTLFLQALILFTHILQTYLKTYRHSGRCSGDERGRKIPCSCAITWIV